MSHQMNTNYDTDLDAFLNYDQNEQTPMSSSSDVKPVPGLLHQYSDVSSQFSGPSYQYDSHRQQTGLPMGGYANTLAVNQASGLHYRPGNHGFVMPTETLNIPLSNLDDFDFNRSNFEPLDMELESDSPADLPTMFSAGEGSSFSPATQMPPRIYPGMHTKQAAQAKIQQAQQQQELVRLQQQKRVLAGQQPLPMSTPKAVPSVKEAHVEESISRVLSRMREKSITSAVGDDDGDSPGDSMSMPRMKKDEEDMDEDERLLNSEEGKKLSSKERRQLRNKVSARAFRSRRKEYITQLEAELAQKGQESNELRVQNRQLMEENTRLTDLTRMLLSSQAFSGFLQELSNSGVPNMSHQQSSQAQQQQIPAAQPQPTRKDVANHEAARKMQSQNHQNQMQIGMTLIPETPLDMSVFDGHHSWNTVIPSNDYQVYSVSELPEPPKLDLSAITEKNSNVAPIRSTKKDLPVVSSLPTFTKSHKDAPTIPASDDLYSGDVQSVSVSLPTTLYTTLCKASVASDLLSVRSTKTTGSWSELRQFCNELDESCDRIAQFI